MKTVACSIVLSATAALALLALPSATASASAQIGAPAADLAKGKAQFARCASCHSVTASGPKRIGPQLNGIVGKPAGKQVGFRYTPAMAKSGIIWSPEKLDEFLAKPRAVVPGTSMVFAGMPDAAARKALIAYLAAQP